MIPGHVDRSRRSRRAWPVLLLAALLVWVVGCTSARGETFAPLGDAGPPTTFDALWDGFDPRAEPLETEVLHEWEQDGVVLRVVRFRIGVFKGEPAMLAGVYGFPVGGEDLPALLQVHGGGQYADYRAPLVNAQRGYATLSIAWAGRISAPDYTVNPAGVQAFWAGEADALVTTDWGAVDGYHAPRRSDIGDFASDQPGAWTLDPVASPRNSGWFLAAVAARRGLTFLERQPEVDADRLGVYGHSMGGKITVMTTAADDRVRAAAPSCGGISHREDRNALFAATLGDDISLPHIDCPILFLSPSNDFHGRIDDLAPSVEAIQSADWRLTCSPHVNHRDTGPYTVNALLWFDQHLKGEFTYPQTPQAQLTLQAVDGMPVLTVRADDAMPIERVDIYYTQQGNAPGVTAHRDDTIHRFWHHAQPQRSGDAWSAPLALSDTDRPLWVYANVTYALGEPVTMAGYYYNPQTAESIVLSSVMQVASPDELAQAGCRATLEPSRVIEPFEPGWRQAWFTHAQSGWAMRTNKLGEPLWQAPDHASLVIEARSPQVNTFVVGIDGYAAEVTLEGGEAWQRIELTPGDFLDAHEQPLAGWDGIRQLRLVPVEHLRAGHGAERIARRVGAPWQGADPEFRLIRWHTPEDASLRPGYLDIRQPSLSDVFPPPTFTAENAGSFRGTASFSPAPGPWQEGLDERDVFRMAMTHEQGPLNSYELRVGLGGQIYSLQGAFGESVPPSWRPQGALSPWNDEVWQFVSVCTRYNMAQRRDELPEWLAAAAPYKTTYFIHNSGCYMGDAAPDSGLTNLYCPLLASDYDPESRTYRQVNWGMVPQLRTIHRSPILYYTQVRDAGGGVIELTWVVHNFSTHGDVVFDYHNAPWGGTRVSSLPLTHVAMADGTLMPDVPGEDNEGPFARGTDVRNTGGFTVSSVDDAVDSPSLALVFGLDRHRDTQARLREAGEPFVQHNHSVYRSWRANGPAYRNQWADFRNMPPQSFRNYQVVEFIPKLILRPQETIWYRSYLVVGGRQQSIEQARELVDHVDYGGLTFDPAQTPMVGVLSEDGEPLFNLFAHPVPGTLPVFALRHKPTGQTVVTTDPYFFTPQQALDLDVPEDHPDHDYFSSAVGYTLDGQTEFLGLLGYGYRAASDLSRGWVPLSQAAPGVWAGDESAFHVDVLVRPVGATAP